MTERLTDLGGGITICHQSFGDPADPPVLLVMGLGTQMIGWHEDLCTDLAGRGLHVIRFDNRDIGRSTHLDHLPRPTTGQIIRRRFGPEQYTLDDMAADAAGLLDALEIESAHVVGASMGGMIAQNLAANHGQRVRSLVSIMSSTGSRFKGQPAPSVYKYLLRRPPESREEFLERAVELFSVIGSPGFERDEDLLREIAATSYERDRDPSGTGRQLAAILKSGNRTNLLQRISAPTTVIHGKADRLVGHSGGKATAAAIPNARLVLIDGMGHDLPREVWPHLVDAVTAHAELREPTHA